MILLLTKCMRLWTAFFVLAISLLAAGIASRRYTPPAAGSFVVRNIPDLKTYPHFPGLTHITIAGAVRDGMKEVEVWIQTIAPGNGTGIHRHDMEEVLVIVKGHGTVNIAPKSAKNKPGKPVAYEFGPNSTFIVPVNARHQITNTDKNEDMFLYAIFSRPPMILYMYDSWNSSYNSGVKIPALPWDQVSWNSLPN